MPTNVQEIRQFIGLCNFFRAHVRNVSLIGAPLNRLTSKAADWKDSVFPVECMEAYNSLKQALLSEPIVDYTGKNWPYSLIVDALIGQSAAGGLGAILTQRNENNDQRVIVCARGQLLKHENNCTPFEWSKYDELVAILGKNAITVSLPLFSKWLCQHCLPLAFISDNGVEFCNQIIKKLLELLSIKKTHTSRNVKWEF